MDGGKTGGVDTPDGARSGGTHDEVMATLALIDAMRAEGCNATEISDALATRGAPVPGGGDWSPFAVDHILEVFDSVRLEASSAAPSRRPIAPPRPPVAPPRRPVGTVDEPVEPPALRHSEAGPTAAESEQVASVAPELLAPVGSLASGQARSDRAERPQRRGVVRVARWTGVGLALAGVGAAGFLAAQAVTDRGGRGVETDRETAQGSMVTTSASTTPGADDTEVQAAIPPTTEVPAPADTLTIRIDPADDSPESSGGLAPATATIRNDGKLYLEGAFGDQAEADAFLEQAGAIFGAENIVEDYVVDATAPAHQVADVALDKPVLFESGTTEIHPDYIDFLEACAGVLALNPHIVMSISAYTDSMGDADYNLELSRQRAQAIVDFYRERDIDASQLLGTGLGESDPVADNETEEGRTENRRAMLRLLNVMDAGQ